MLLSSLSSSSESNILMKSVTERGVVDFGTATVDEGVNPSAPSPGVATTGGGVLPPAGAVWLMLFWLFDMML